MFKQAVAVLSSALLIVSVWAGSIPVGTIDMSHGAMLSGVRATVGATVFEGDTLAVSPKGAVALDLRDGSRVVMSSNSDTRLTRNASHLAVEVNHGGVILNVATKSALEGLIGDASFRPSGSGPSTAWMGFTGPKHIVLYAERGEWIVSTGHDGRSLVLNQGERLDGEISSLPGQQQGTTVSQENKKKKHKKLAVIWIGSAIVGTITGLGLAYGMSECTTGSGPGCHSPATPVASPVTP